MRDLQYLNSIYESLEEGVGIKTTKLKKYYDAATGYESQRNPQTRHGELINPARRSVRYDYGKANYDEISAEEAIRLVKQDKHNIQKLRIIYRLNDASSLVEYEVRDNGSVYAIYGSADSITIDGKTYKNIRYAPWKKVIENADLIYVTDEYDKYLDADPEVAQARADKNKYSQLPLPADRTADGFDAHHPYANMYTGGDSGWNARARYAQVSIDTGAHRFGDRYHPTVAASINPYLQAQHTVRELYQQLDRYRRALRKLETDKEFLDEEEYNKKKSKWDASYNNTLKLYRDAIAEMKKIEAKVDKEIDSKIAAFVDKLRTNIYEYDQALTKGFELSEKIKKLKGMLVGDLVNSNSYSYELKRASNNIQSAAKEIRRVKDILQQILNNAEADEQSAQSAELDVISAANTFEANLSRVDTLKLEALQRHLNEIENIAQQLRDIDVKLAELRPKAAAAKAARAAKNKTAELDPDLVDILDFSETTEDTVED